MKCINCNAEVVVPVKMRFGLESRRIVTCSECGAEYKLNGIAFLGAGVLAGIATILTSILSRGSIGYLVWIVYFYMIYWSLLQVKPLMKRPYNDKV